MTVSGTWDGGIAASWQTAADGTCVVSLTKQPRSQKARTFTVTGIGGGYDSTANHDPDGDSNGATIT